MNYWFSQWEQQNVYIHIILYVFAVAILFQILYYWIVFGKVAFYNFKKHVSQSHDLPPISVLIVAQNNYKNLRKNLISILNQEYSDFEVVVVNCSDDSDDSRSFLQVQSEEFPHLKYVELSNVKTFYAKKKFLIALATKEAKNNTFLLTNIDCKPKSKYWIKSMAEKFSGKAELVLGYNGLTTHKGFFNKFYRLDRINFSLTYFSLALQGLPCTGTGNNLAYTRSLFSKKNGLVPHYSIPYGDDTLFINQNAKKENTAIALDANSITQIQAKTTFNTWLREKKIGRLSQKHYQPMHRFVLSLFPFTRFLCYLTFIAALCLLPLDILCYSVVGVFLLRMISQLIITKNAMKKFEEKNLLFLTPLLEPLYMICSLLHFFSANFGRKVKM